LINVFEFALLPLSYVYLKCGRNFTPGRGRVSPYTSVEGEERIMLKPGEDAHIAFEEWVLNRKITKDIHNEVIVLKAGYDPHIIMEEHSLSPDFLMNLFFPRIVVYVGYTGKFLHSET
jgi:hypothetical protein